MKKSLHLIAIAMCMFAITSCNKTAVEKPQTINAAVVQNEPAPPKPQKENVPELGLVITGACEPTSVTLIAGQSMNSGSVTVTNDANFIYVTYSTTNGWVLTQTHLYVGNCALIPVNNPGNPIPGQFPYTGAHSNITSYTYQIPISKIPLGVCGCIAAHAVVKQLNGSGQVIQTQTAWGQGSVINSNGGNWGMKFEYCSCTP